jgi:hypothetical protein
MTDTVPDSDHVTVPKRYLKALAEQLRDHHRGMRWRQAAADLIDDLLRDDEPETAP